MMHLDMLIARSLALSRKRMLHNLDYIISAGRQAQEPRTKFQEPISKKLLPAIWFLVLGIAAGY
jgi:hypothetical protein